MSQPSESNNNDLEELQRLRRDNEVLRAQSELLKINTVKSSVSDFDASSTFDRLTDSTRTLCFDDFTTNTGDKFNLDESCAGKAMLNLDIVEPQKKSPSLPVKDESDSTSENEAPILNDNQGNIIKFPDHETSSDQPQGSLTPTMSLPVTAVQPNGRHSVSSSRSSTGSSSSSHQLNVELPSRIQYSTLIPSTSKESSSANAFRQIRVESGLLAESPQQLRITPRQLPCAVFVVTNPENGEVDWRFVKEYDQLKNFHSLIKSIIDPFLKKGSVKLANFPPRSFFTRLVPWKVDVRIDMLNAYFYSVAELYTNRHVVKRPKIRNALDQAAAALWLHDIVDLPKTAESSTALTGFLSTRADWSTKWKCNYCILNGAFLDIIENSASGSVTKSISLYRARIIMRIVFFDTTDTDERYSIKICERKPGGNYRVHHLTAESEPKRQEWLRKLRQCVARSDSREISRKYREFSSNDLPSPYKIRPSPQRSAYLPQENVQESRRRNGTRSQARASVQMGAVDVRTCPNTTKLSAYDALQNDDERSSSDQQSVTSGSGSGIFDGGDFYMKISKPMGFQTSEESPIKNISNQAAISKSAVDFTTSLTSSNTNVQKLPIPGSNYIYGPSPPYSSKSLANRDIGKPVKGKIFGVPPKSCTYLVTLPNGDRVPSVVARCVSLLEHPISLCELGIFRTSGTQTLIDDLQEEFDLKGDTNLARRHIDVNTIADLLKRYLRSLPAPILGEWSEEMSKEAFTLSHGDQFRVLSRIVFDSDSTSFCTAHCILELLSKVSTYERRNAMGIWNLSVALSPALKVPAPVVQMFIQNQKELFANAPNKGSIHIPTTITPQSV